MEKNSCISIYPDSRFLEQALRRLQWASIDLQQASVMGKGCHPRALPVGFCHIGERARFYGPASAFWERVWDLLTDAACVWVPGTGVLAAAGYIVPLMVRGLQRTEVSAGLSAPGAAMFGIGIPRHSIDEYEQAINAENYLLLVSGQCHEVERACDLLHGGVQQVTVHKA
ncbi:hypothetical protein MNBD_GAMMA13-1708 [hydrothermal vent metagenome]|uniref:DUF1269 domain-containing protein n=1 Tax=hydrothermal vent metagenome TaxID=652676 RepID=A0A3B0YH85_9ZZZZ